MLSINLSIIFPHPNMISHPLHCQVPSLKLFSIRKKNLLPCLAPTAPAAANVAAAELRPELMPKHVALIMDGNGRWGRSRGLQPQFGHNAGVVTLKNLIINCCEFLIKVLTVFAFSTENWNRSQVEVDFLMKIIENMIRFEVMDLIKRYSLRFSAIGVISRLPKSLQSAISSAEEASHDNKGLHLIMAVNYGGRYEIAEACKKIAAEVKEGVLTVDAINESLLEKRMMTNITVFPNPDLVIRTSGEFRVSNFLLWQLAYAELYFTSKSFPDFERADLIEAIASFQSRKRRFGHRPN